MEWQMMLAKGHKNYVPAPAGIIIFQELGGFLTAFFLCQKL